MAAAAYRAGEKLHSKYYGEDSDYTRKGGVICSEILLPSHAPPEYADRETLWNAVEKAEHGKKAQLAYSFDIALQNPVLLNSQRRAHMIAFAHLLKNQQGLISSGSWDYYPEIGEKLKIKLLQNIDEHLNTEEVFCVGDTSLFKRTKNGIVFTMHGVYIRPMMEKTFYFNYADVERWQIQPNEKQREDLTRAKLVFVLRDGTEYVINDAFYRKDILANAIECLRCADRVWNFALGHRKTGTVVDEEENRHKLIAGIAAVGGGAIGSVAKVAFGMNVKNRAKYRVLGMQSAYEMASDEYEEKLLKQAEAFKKDRALLTKDIIGYRELLKIYEAYITALEATHDEAKVPLIQRLQAECNELKALEASIDES